MNRPSAILATLIFGPIAIISAVMGYWAQQRDPCYTILSGNPSPNPASAGSPVNLQWKVDVKSRDCSGTFFRVLEQPGRWIWVTSEFVSAFTVLPLGINYTHSTQPMIVPNNAEDGEYQVYTVVKFYRNPLQEWLNWPIVYYGSPAKISIRNPRTEKKSSSVWIDRDYASSTLTPKQWASPHLGSTLVQSQPPRMGAATEQEETYYEKNIRDVCTPTARLLCGQRRTMLRQAID